MGGSGSLLYFVLGGYVWARSQEATFFLVALAYAAGISMVLFGIAERPTHLDEVKPKATTTFWNYLRDLRKHEALLNYALASLFWQVGLNAVLPWLTSFGTIEMGMSVEMSFLILALSVGVLIAFAVPVGLLADRFGRLRLTSLGLLLFVIVNSAVFFVHSIPLLFVLMGIVSFGFCILMVVPYAMMVDLIPEERMGELIGVAVVPVYLSILIGPSFAGLLIDIFGSYRPVFALAAACHAVGFALLLRVKEKAVAPSELTPSLQ
jgi:MFS family permease